MLKIDPVPKNSRAVIKTGAVFVVELRLTARRPDAWVDVESSNETPRQDGYTIKRQECRTAEPQ